MSLKEKAQNLFKPREVSQAEKLMKRDEAYQQEEQSIVAYIKGEISSEEYHQRMAETYPLTKIDLRKLAS